MMNTHGAHSPSEAPTPIGQVLSARGSEAQVGLPAPWTDDDARPTVGKFMVLNAGSVELIGMISEVEVGDPGDAHNLGSKAIAKISLMGEIKADHEGEPHFKRGVSVYPAIGDSAYLITGEQLRLIFNPADRRTINIGQMNHDSSINASVDVDNLISKHFAVLGSTGVGKSSGVAVILSEIMRARPDIRLFLLDGHNEYGSCFGEQANVIDPRSFKLPFWIFNFEELTDVIYGGRPAVAEEVEILSELIPIAKATYLSYKTNSSKLGIRKVDPKQSGITVDTPVPYLLQDLLSLIDNRMGKLENRSSRMNYHRLTSRLETITNDPRYAFMFENISVGGDTMVDLLSHLFRLAPDGRPISVMQMAGLPADVTDAVVCVLCRLAFDFGLWSDGAMPLLFVCEEAHRYASANPAVGFGPTRRALARIAKEGRKYGVFLGLVTQRPAELDPTIISQCSTLFAMRMANDQDQTLLRSAVADAAANLLDFVPSLGTGEVVGFGEGMPMPARLTFTRLDANMVPRSESSVLSADGELDSFMDRDFLKSVVDRWRGSMNEAKGPEHKETVLPKSEPAQSRSREINSELSELGKEAKMLEGREAVLQKAAPARSFSREGNPGLSGLRKETREPETRRAAILKSEPDNSFSRQGNPELSRHRKSTSESANNEATAFHAEPARPFSRERNLAAPDQMQEAGEPINGRTILAKSESARSNPREGNSALLGLARRQILKR